ncbi:hypothetical protein PRIPAC_75627 [Pristionchus pacificus]|uniref:ShK domain-containing protein n=1 Tax=Pristionchus pacificus TaxID=54126 RepID=A0A2A6C0L2_PRIPA|nr:hypothetical protein PRIPAC_75627 [Pristionchus pacificus]|eukprot:PDM71792.1 ShK domain-containing protein [Pristionchus pacificus]
MFLPFILFSSLVGLVGAQCTGDDDPRCSGWLSNGFCSNTGYTMDMRKQYCGVSCGFCNADGTQTAAGGGSIYSSCVDANANCASWDATGFCTNPSYSNSMKLLYCCATCRPTLLATTTTTTSGSTTTSASSTTTTTTVAPRRKIFNALQVEMYLPLILSSFVALVGSQCTGNDAPQCASWVSRAGFCSNTGYTMNMRKQYCGVRCGFCNTDGTQTAAGGGSSYSSCTDKNANCASWNASGFCANQTISNSLKLLYCCSTCRPALLASTSTTSRSSTSTTTGTTTTTTTVAPGGRKCASWVSKANFCSNTGYTMEMRKQYCGVRCGFCNADGTQTAAGGGSNYGSCVDKNANCASWAATGFCTNPSTSNSMKLLYCCATCRPTVLFGTTTTAASGSTTVTGSTTTMTTTTTSVMYAVAVFLLALVPVLLDAQCTGNDAPQCASWVSNAGFCSNTGYTMDMRKQYCGVRCGYCNTDGTQTALGGGSSYSSCVDKNANCASWNAGGFCANQTISNSLKLLYCCSTCRPALLATSSSSTTTTTTTTTAAPAGGK